MAKKIVPQELCLICCENPCECGSKPSEKQLDALRRMTEQAEELGLYEETPDAPPSDS